MLIITDPNQQAALGIRFNQKLKDSYGLAVNSVKNEAAYKQIQHAINALKISAMSVEINPGTTSTPGQHLRIIGFSSTELTNLAKALNDVGINTEFNNDSSLKTLVIKNPNPDVALKFKFTQTLKVSYDNAASTIQNQTLTATKINPSK